MRIGLQTWGSHGDVRPFVALAEGLQAAGHEVTLVITCVDSDRYRELVSPSGVKLQLVATPVLPDKVALERAGAAVVGEGDAIRQTQLAIEHFLLPAEAAMAQASDRLCASNDLVIGHYFLYTLGVAAEVHRRPHVSVMLAHGAIPSGHRPPSGLPSLGTMGNRLAWALARRVLNKAFKQYPDRLRAAQGLGAARDMVDSVWASDALTLVAVSPTLCPPRPDWPAHYQVCGPLDIQGSIAEGQIAEPLQAFLRAGSAPICMSLGSMMAGSDAKQTLALLVEAARAAAVRAVVQAPGWEGLGVQSDAQIHFVDAAPHAPLFPQCRAVVHHGGAGTSHAALRAGVPSVVVPHTAEQAMWARELQGLGVALRPIARRRATVERLAAAIRDTVQAAHLRENASRVSLRMAQEDGVAHAVRLINERFAG